jgi:hypothetical protein
MVPKRRRGMRTVMEAVTNEKWIEDIRAEISTEVLMEFRNYQI